MPSFNPEPFEEFLAAHVGESWRRVEVRRAVLPVLQDLVERDYAFRPLVVGDLDRLRADLQALFGFAVRDVRTVSIEAVLAPLPDESDEARAKRVEASVNAIDDQHIDLSDLLGEFEAWSDWRVSETVDDALEAAYDAALPLPDADPVRSEAIQAAMRNLLFPLQALALFAAVVEDDVVFKRFEPILKWLSRCVPLGGLKAEPGVITVLVK